MRLAPQWMRQRFERLDKWFSGIKALDDADHQLHDKDSFSDQEDNTVPDNNSSNPA